MKLIDADALMSTIKESYNCTYNPAEDNCDDCDCLPVLRIVEAAPTIDAVPVIRCKDCNFFDTDGYCYLHDDNKTEDSFCSDAVRCTDE